MHGASEFLLPIGVLAPAPRSVRGFVTHIRELTFFKRELGDESLESREREHQFRS